MKNKSLSIRLAAVNNPDPETNPVQSLEDYYDFLDWSATCMPWNILDGQDTSDLYSSIDQSLDYFYYLLDQPLHARLQVVHRHAASRSRYHRAGIDVNRTAGPLRDAPDDSANQDGGQRQLKHSLHLSSFL